MTDREHPFLDPIYLLNLNVACVHRQLNVKYPKRTPTPHGCYLVKLLDYKSVSEEEEEKKQQAVLASWW